MEGCLQREVDNRDATTPPSETCPSAAQAQPVSGVASIEFKISGPPEIANRLSDLFALLTTNTALVRELESLKGAVKHMSDTLASEITQLQTDVSALTSEVAAANMTITTFAGELAKALAAATGAGATPEQLQALTDLHSAITGATASLDSTIKANPLPTETPAPAAEPTP